jgi:hypothetical protein
MFITPFLYLFIIQHLQEITEKERALSFGGEGSRCLFYETIPESVFRRAGPPQQ